MMGQNLGLGKNQRHILRTLETDHYLADRTLRYRQRKTMQSLERIGLVMCDGGRWILTITGLYAVRNRRRW